MHSFSTTLNAKFLGRTNVSRILEGVHAKNLDATVLFVDFSKAFDFIHRGKMEQILLAYGISKETITAIMLLYKNSKVKVRSSDGDTYSFDIDAGVLLHGDTSVPYVFIISLDNVLQTSIDLIKENVFTLAKAKSRRYPARTITDGEYADDIAHLANTPTKAESLVQSLKRAAFGIGLHVNTDETEFTWFSERVEITTLWNLWTSSPISEDETWYGWNSFQWFSMSRAVLASFSGRSYSIHNREE